MCIFGDREGFLSHQEHSSSVRFAFYAYPLWTCAVFASPHTYTCLLINWPKHHLFAFIVDAIRPERKKKHSNFFFLVTECYCLIGLYIWDFSLFFVIVCSWPFRYTFKKKSPSPTLHRSNGDFIIIDRKQSRHINRMKNNPNGNRYIFQFNWEHCYFLFRFISSLARFLCVSCFLLFHSSYVYHLLMWSTSTRKKEWKKNRRNLKWRNIATINKWKANKIKRIWRYVLLSSSLFPS